MLVKIHKHLRLKPRTSTSKILMIFLIHMYQACISALKDSMIINLSLIDQVDHMGVIAADNQRNITVE